jgi:hypothetical protein
MLTNKTRTQGGRCIKGVGVVRDKELKVEDGESSHIEGTGKGVTKERKWRGGERFGSGRGECSSVK